MTGKELVQQYLASRSQFARHTVGKVSVTISTSLTGGMPRVEVNWPGIGDKAPVDALAFATDLLAASTLGIQAESAMDSWDGVDQWREHGGRTSHPAHDEG